MVFLSSMLLLTWELSVPAGMEVPPVPAKPTGCAVGAEMPIFYVREVTGSRPNLAVCLVCRNGDRPVVMISARKIDQQVKRLIEAVDRTVDAHRADGLRGFAIFLAPQGKELTELQAQVQTLARDRNLSIPLALPVESLTGPASLNIPTDVQTTVLLYVEKKIVSSNSFKSGELSQEKITQIIQNAQSLVPPDATGLPRKTSR